MKMPWLLRILAALLVFVPTELATVQEPLPDVGPALRRRWPCPGCYGALEMVPNPEVKHPCPGCDTSVLQPAVSEDLDSSILPSILALHKPIKGDPPKGNMWGGLRLSGTTTPLQRLRNKTRIYRYGSWSALSRTAIDLSLLQGEKPRNTSHPERDAVFPWDPCLGCCSRGLWPHRPGGREDQPSQGGSGHTPTTAVPRRNGTLGDFRPGAYTPMRRMRRTRIALGTVWTHPREDGPTPAHCQGCCRVNPTAGANPPGRRDEGKGFSNKPTPGGSPSKGAWRPVLDRKGPNYSQTEEEEWWPVFSRGAVPPWPKPTGW